VGRKGDNFVHHKDVRLCPGTILAFFGVHKENCCLHIQGENMPYRQR